jgi:uridine kinase
MSPRILGIAGGTASGKTTAALAVAEALGDRCVLVTHDRYYHPVPESLKHDPAQHNFDHPDALDTARLVEDLRALRSGQATRVPHYDFTTHRRLPEPAWEALEPREVIVVEGILVLVEPELRALMDHRVFVHAPDDIRLLRRIRRDVQERGRAVEEILAQYERTVRPMHEAWVVPSADHADLVLDGLSPVEQLVGHVLELLDGQARRSPAPDR